MGIVAIHISRTTLTKLKGVCNMQDKERREELRKLWLEDYKEKSRREAEVRMVVLRKVKPYVEWAFWIFGIVSIISGILMVTVSNESVTNHLFSVFAFSFSFVVTLPLFLLMLRTLDDGTYP